MNCPFRRKVYSCIQPETYKYFLPREAVENTWVQLTASYGQAVRNNSVNTMTIETPELILRSTIAGNPITVIRRRRCTASDIDRLHAILGFASDNDQGEL